MTFKLDIVAETKDWIALNKPSGLNVEQLWDYPSLEQLVREYLQQQRKKNYVGIVHRLDRPVSGLTLVAKKKSMLKSLNQQFAERQVSKTYHAITANMLPTEEGVLVDYIRKDQQQKRAVIGRKGRPNSFRAELHYRLLRPLPQKRYLWEIHPITGKFHQIRLQLAHRECPIIGDEKYGSKNKDAANAIALHAILLNFFDPASGTEVTLNAPIPSRNTWSGTL